MVPNQPTRLYLYVISSLGALLLYASAFGDLIFKSGFEGTHRVVTSAEDIGPGTLRQALLEAQDNDIITFDPSVFPPAAPVTISVASRLPGIIVDNLVLDASNAGVVLDGSLLTGDWEAGLELISCEGATVRGLRIANFSGRGIDISGGARYNVIGGDRNTGTGPFGQGNQLIHNGIGVILAAPGTTGNTIKGNLLGTDAAGTALLGNEREGIALVEGANGNTIGPANIIAHNNAQGIFLYGKNTINNTITRNSIHDNGDSRGIEQQVGANTKLIFPSLLDFDLSAGTIAGVTCSNCRVEFFSDDSWDGAVYEGVTVADAGGVFAFDKGVAFLGPQVTATATDTDGNTSPFSPPLSGVSRTLSLQQSNHLPRTQIQPRHAEHNADNRMGMRGELGRGDVTEDWVERSKNRVGGTWVFELTIDNLEWSGGAEYGGYSEYYINPTVNQAITELYELGFTMIYNLAFWDAEIEPEPCYARFRKEEEIQRYLDYIQWLVHNFKDRTQIFEMLIEPRYTCGDFDQQNIEVNDYIALVKRVIPTIQQESPGAKLVVGAVVLFHDSDYLRAILESDVMPLVDGISWHPFFGESPEYEPQYYYDYPNTVQEIKDLAAANGFNGEFIVTSIGWDASDYGEVGAAKYLARGIVLHLGMDVVAGYGGSEPWPDEQLARFRVARNLGTVMDEVRAASFPVQIQTALTNTAVYTFARGDDKLVGLWSDGIATDYDPGVAATLTIPGLGDYAATAIDVLYGYRQPLTTENVDGDLVVRDLLVVDYPILLRLSAP